MFSPPSTAFHLDRKKGQSNNSSVGHMFHQSLSPGFNHPGDKSSGQPVQRLNLSFPPMTAAAGSFDPSMQDLRKTMNQPPPTDAETKWFSSYNTDSAYTSASSPTDIHHQSRVNRHHHPSKIRQPLFSRIKPQLHPGSNSFSAPFFQECFPPMQAPYNLTTGEYEFWYNKPVSHMSYQSFPVEEATVSYSVTSLAPSAVMSSIAGVVGWMLEGVGLPCSSPKPHPSNLSDANMSLSASLTPSKSTLNPNAKVFKPSLNPNAKEFSPLNQSSPKLESISTTVLASSTACHNESPASVDAMTVVANEAAANPVTPDCVTPTPSEMDVPMKSTADRLCTPWVSTGEPCPRLLNNTTSSEETDEEDIHLDGDDSHDEVEETETESDDDDEEDEDETDDDEDVKARQGNLRTHRQRSLSSCSEESFIEFTASSPADSPTVVVHNNCDRKKRQPRRTSGSSGGSGGAVKKLATVAKDSDDESATSTDTYEDDDDGDWDEVDRSVVLDDDEFREQMTNFGFECPMLVPAFVNTGNNQRLTIENVEPDESVSQRIHGADESSPFKDKVSPAETELRIREANRVWNELSGGKILKEILCPDLSPRKRATFAQPEVCQEYFEDPAMADDLRASRISDMAQRRADHQRMERLIAPILNEDHRQRVWEKIYG